MGKSKISFRFLLFCTVLFFAFAFYNCGGDDENSSTNSFTQLSKINGQVTDVFVQNSQSDKTVYAKLLKLMDVVNVANAQGFSPAGITVVALQLVGVEEIFVDEDITDESGGFSLEVPAGEIILQFIIDDNFFETTLNVPEETTLEIFVNIDADDPLNPVELSEIEILDQEDSDEILDDSVSGDLEENSDGNPSGDDDDDDDNPGSGDGSPSGDDDDNDDNPGSGDGNPSGDDDDDDDNPGSGDGSPSGDDDDDDDNPGSGDGSPSGDDDDDDDNPGSGDGSPSGDDDDDSIQGNGVITSSAMLISINSRRAQGANCGSRGVFDPQLPLSVNLAIGQAALRHSDDMASFDFFSHTGSDSTNPIQRMTQAGFNGNAWGENISRSTFQRTADQVVAGWMTSDSHCANIMSQAFTKMGSAKASSISWEYWTLDLGN